MKKLLVIGFAVLLSGGVAITALLRHKVTVPFPSVPGETGPSKTFEMWVSAGAPSFTPVPKTNFTLVWTIPPSEIPTNYVVNVWHTTNAKAQFTYGMATNVVVARWDGETWVATNLLDRWTLLTSFVGQVSLPISNAYAGEWFTVTGWRINRSLFNP